LLIYGLTVRSDGLLYLDATACSNGSPFICIKASLFITNGECFSSGMYVGVENIDGGSFLEEIVDGSRCSGRCVKA
jgi:hypothetical protein